jgi:hypothetical protein
MVADGAARVQGAKRTKTAHFAPAMPVEKYIAALIKNPAPPGDVWRIFS